MSVLVVFSTPNFTSQNTGKCFPGASGVATLTYHSATSVLKSCENTGLLSGFSSRGVLAQPRFIAAWPMLAAAKTSGKAGTGIRRLCHSLAYSEIGKTAKSGRLTKKFRG